MELKKSYASVVLNVPHIEIDESDQTDRTDEGDETDGTELTELRGHSTWPARSSATEQPSATDTQPSATDPHTRCRRSRRPQMGEPQAR